MKWFGLIMLYGILVSNAWAGWYEGTVEEIRYYGSTDNNVLILKRSSDSVLMPMSFDSSMSADAKKQLIAMLLTAKSTGASVNAYLSSNGFNALKLLP